LAGISTRVELDGGLFEKPGQIVNYHVGVMSKELAQQAEVAVKFQGQTSFRYESSAPTGAWARAIRTRVAAAVGGLKAWEVHDSDIIYGPWLEGVGSRNYPTTRFRGYSTFRKVAQQIERKAPRMLTTETRRMVKDLEK
jgi:hypothetical protein